MHSRFGASTQLTGTGEVTLPAGAARGAKVSNFCVLLGYTSLGKLFFLDGIMIGIEPGAVAEGVPCLEAALHY